MSVILLPNQWKRQPQTPVRVIPSHPLLTAMRAEVAVLPSVSGQNLIRLNQPVISGTPTKTAGSLGSAGSGMGVSFNAGGGSSAGYYQYTGNVAASALGNTAAFVFIRNATNNSGVNYFYSFETSLNSGLVSSLTFNNGQQYSQYFAGTQQGTSVTVSIDVPYFVIASTETKGASSAWYFKILNLQTGTLTADQSGTATVNAGGSGSWTVAGSAAFGYGLTGHIFSSVLGSQYLPPTLANRWLENHWQIFQPLSRRIWVGVAAAPGGASNAPRYFHRTQAGQA